MRRHTTRTTWAVLCLAPAAIAWTSLSSTLTLQPNSRLWISGTSTVRSFQCGASSIQSRVESTGPGAVRAVMAGEKAVRGAEIRVAAAALDCRNGTMNEHMLKALKAKENPTITFKVASYEVAKAADGSQGSATGELTLGGVQKTITVVGSVTEEGDGVLRIKGTHELRMSDYGLKPPTLMLGTMKVGNLVKVGFDLSLKDAPPVTD